MPIELKKYNKNDYADMILDLSSVCTTLIRKRKLGYHKTEEYCAIANVSIVVDINEKGISYFKKLPRSYLINYCKWTVMNVICTEKKRHHGPTTDIMSPKRRYMREDINDHGEYNIKSAASRFINPAKLAELKDEYAKISM